MFLLDVAALPRHELGGQIVPQFIAQYPVHRTIRQIDKMVDRRADGLDSILMRGQPRVLYRRVEHRLLPIHKQIAEVRVDPSVPIKRLKVAEKTRGKIAVART